MNKFINILLSLSSVTNINRGRVNTVLSNLVSLVLMLGVWHQTGKKPETSTYSSVAWLGFFVCMIITKKTLLKFSWLTELSRCWYDFQYPDHFSLSRYGSPFLNIANKATSLLVKEVNLVNVKTSLVFELNWKWGKIWFISFLPDEIFHNIGASKFVARRS